MEAREAPVVGTSEEAVAYYDGLYVGVGTGGRIATSTNAVDWTERASPTDTWLGVVMHGGDRFMAGGLSGTLVSSVDGITWSNHPPISFYPVSGLAHGNG